MICRAVRRGISIVNNSSHEDIYLTEKLGVPQASACPVNQTDLLALPGNRIQTGAALNQSSPCLGSVSNRVSRRANMSRSARVRSIVMQNHVRGTTQLQSQREGQPKDKRHLASVFKHLPSPSRMMRKTHALSLNQPPPFPWLRLDGETLCHSVAEMFSWFECLCGTIHMELASAAGQLKISLSVSTIPGTAVSAVD